MFNERININSLFWSSLGWGSLALWLSSIHFAPTNGQLFACLMPKPDNHQLAWGLAQKAAQYAPFCLTSYPSLKFFDWALGKIRPPDDIAFKRSKEFRDIFTKVTLWMGAGLLLTIMLVKFG